MPPKADRSGDRHRLKSLSRLDDPDDDAWLRAYATQKGQSVMKVVSAAIRHYRSFIENDENKERK